MSKSLSQLQIEAQQAADALAAAQAEAAKAEQAAKDEAARQAAIAKREEQRNAPVPAAFEERTKHLTAIANALTKLEHVPTHTAVRVTEPKRNVRETDDGPVVEWSAPQLVVAYRGKDTYARVEFMAERQGGSARFSFTSRHTGRVRMTVGDYGDAQSFPPKKNGTFNYDAAALKLLPALVRAEATHNAAVAKAKNAGSLGSLRAEFSLSEYSEVVRTEKHVRNGYDRNGYTVTAPAGMVLLSLDKQVTPEQARAILAAAVAAGVKL